MEIKIKWIKRKQMTHENTYRDDNYKSFGKICILYIITEIEIEISLLTK